MKTLNDYEVNGALYQGGTGPEAQVGDQVKLYLNTEAVPGLPEFIVGVIQHPIVKINCDSATSYDIEYDEADLLGVVAFIVPGNVIDAVVITATDVLIDAIDDEVTRATAAEAALDASITAEVDRATAAEVVLSDAIAAETVRATDEEAAIRNEFVAADDLLQIRPLERTAAEGAPLVAVAGQAQIERLSPTGAVATAGNALLTLTSASVVGSPKAYNVPLSLADGPTEIVAAVEAVLSADSDVTDIVTLVNNGTSLDLIVKAIGGSFVADDPTLFLHIEDSTSVGVDHVDSTDQQAAIVTVSATDPVHVGRWCRVGDTAPFDWFQADTLTTWVMRFSGAYPVTYNTDQSVYQSLVGSGAAGSEILTITDL